MGAIPQTAQGLNEYAAVANAAYPFTTSEILNTTDASGNKIQLKLIADEFDSTGTQQFVAYQAPNGSVIVGIEGTNPLSGVNISTDINTWLSSWQGSSADPSARFLSYLSQAATFINSVSKGPVTVVGHSLGGAEAQILGFYMDLPSIGFNAPGTGSMLGISKLNTALAADIPITGMTGTAPTENVSVKGDGIHGIDAPVGLQGTLVSGNNPIYNAGKPLQSIWPDHQMSTVISELRDAAKSNPAATLTFDHNATPSLLPGGVINQTVSDDPSQTTLSATGKITFSDADGPSHVVTTGEIGNTIGTLTAVVDKDGASGEITWTYNVSEAAAHLNLNSTDKFLVTLNDLNGGYVGEEVSVTISPGGPYLVKFLRESLTNGVTINTYDVQTFYTNDVSEISRNAANATQVAPYITDYQGPSLGNVQQDGPTPTPLPAWIADVTNLAPLGIAVPAGASFYANSNWLAL